MALQQSNVLAEIARLGLAGSLPRGVQDGYYAYVLRVGSKSQERFVGKKVCQVENIVMSAGYPLERWQGRELKRDWLGYAAAGNRV